MSSFVVLLRRWVRFSESMTDGGQWWSAVSSLTDWWPLTSRYTGHNCHGRPSITWLCRRPLQSVYNCWRASLLPSTTTTTTTIIIIIIIDLGLSALWSLTLLWLFGSVCGKVARLCTTLCVWSVYNYRQFELWSVTRSTYVQVHFFHHFLDILRVLHKVAYSILCCP